MKVNIGLFNDNKGLFRVLGCSSIRRILNKSESDLYCEDIDPNSPFCKKCNCLNIDIETLWKIYKDTWEVACDVNDCEIHGITKEKFILWVIDRKLMN